MSDTSDSGNIKKATVSTITDSMIANGGDNRVLTDTTTAGSINAEANLTFNGSTLNVANNITIADGGTIGSASDADAISISASGDVTISQDLIVNGTTTTVNSTTVTIDDPIFTVGGDSAPGSDDNKDRGIEFRYHDGSSAKLGFFGFDDSTGKFSFIPDATNASEVFSGTKGTIDVGAVESATVSTTGNITSGASFVIGSADMDETDLEKLDGITNGTAAANKALVLGASKEISTITTATITNLSTTTLTGGAITSSNFASTVTTLIKNSSGTTLKTIRSPGS